MIHQQYAPDATLSSTQHCPAFIITMCPAVTIGTSTPMTPTARDVLRPSGAIALPKIDLFCRTFAVLAFNEETAHRQVCRHGMVSLMSAALSTMCCFETAYEPAPLAGSVPL